MRGVSGLSRLIKDYIESRNGRIHWFPHLYLFLDAAKRKIPLLNWKHEPWPDRTDAVTGRVFNLFRGRGAQCFHPDNWKGLFPYWSQEGRRAYFIVPQKECKVCEFHEAAKRCGSKRYASCRWYRENNELKSPDTIFVESVNKAKEIIGEA